MLSRNISYGMLVTSILMLVSCFLPWAEISSSSNLFGVTASYKQSAMGVQTPLGIFTAIVSVVAVLLAVFRTQWVIIPASISFLIALVTTGDSGPC